MTAPSRLSPGAAAGVTEQMIHDLVHGFYDKVRSDAALGPIFEQEIKTWDEHLARMCDFWSSVLLMTGRFKGTPMVAHARLPGIGPDHFARWLELFQQVALEVCPPQAAALFVAKSEMIAQSLQLGIAASRSQLLAPCSEAPAGEPTIKPKACTVTLPNDLQSFRRTPEFTETTVPSALLKAHTTKEGTWGLIHVLAGRLRYSIDDPRRVSSDTILTPETDPGIVEPTILHVVKPQGAVRFFVEFLRRELV